MKTAKLLNRLPSASSKKFCGCVNQLPGKPAVWKSKMNIKYFSIPEMEATGNIKTLFTTSQDTAWNFEDDMARENYLALGAQLGIPLENMVKSKQRYSMPSIRKRT